jgi:hypothetical protein
LRLICLPGSQKWIPPRTARCSSRTIRTRSAWCRHCTGTTCNSRSRGCSGRTRHLRVGRSRSPLAVESPSRHSPRARPKGREFYTPFA